jgi:hypothetical protein
MPKPEVAEQTRDHEALSAKFDFCTEGTSSRGVVEVPRDSGSRIIIRVSQPRAAFRHLQTRANGRAWPKADRLLWAVATLKRSFASAHSRGSFRPKSDVLGLVGYSK